MTLKLIQSNKKKAFTKAVIDYSGPDHSFWEIYNDLWQNSLHKPVFQAPNILKYFTRHLGESLAIYKFFKGEQLVGASIFRKHRGQYVFLSDLRNDHNFFVIHKQCTEEEIFTFFSELFKLAKKDNWSLVLNNHPSWAIYNDKLTEAKERSNLFWMLIKASVCPMLDAETPEALFQKINSKGLRYKMNRLKRNTNFTFEAFTGEEDIDNWIDQFCEAHIRRWENTSTPSEFELEDGQKFYKGCMKAWAQDSILARLSIRIDDKRIAFSAGLIQENSLVGHSLATDASYNEFSPGKVMMWLQAEWMKNQNLNVLDFGYGNEKYKYRFANIDPDLYTIFLSPRSNFLFILKAKLKKTVRENDQLIKFYREKLKPFNQNLRKKLKYRT